MTNGSPRWEAAVRVGTGARACKPNLVCPGRLLRRPRRGHHLSGTAVADRFERPTCTVPRPGSERWRATFPDCTNRGWRVGTVRLGLTPRGVCLAAPVTRSAGALLPHPFTPYTECFRCGTALCCTCHQRRFDVGRNDAVFPLGSTGPYGVRTFLTAERPRNRTRRRSDDPARTPYQTPGETQSSGPRELPYKKAQRLTLPSALPRGRPSLSSRRPSRCRALRRR